MSFASSASSTPSMFSPSSPSTSRSSSILTPPKTTTNRSITNIARAVTELSKSQTPETMTIATVLRVYIRVAGFDTICQDAIRAFEHAMDKEPERIPIGTGSQSQRNGGWEVDEVEAVVRRLREEYWVDKLGGRKECEGVCTCEQCGKMGLKTKGLEEGSLVRVRINDVNSKEGTGRKSTQKKSAGKCKVMQMKTKKA